jgi:DNA-binding transcriptional ArsR family regulator
MFMNGPSELSDSWWAALARRLLHRTQVEIIEALRQSDGPMSARDLSGVIEGTEPGYLAQHHLRRLRKLGAIEYAGDQASRNPVDAPYRLVWELGNDGR